MSRERAREIEKTIILELREERRYTKAEYETAFQAAIEIKGWKNITREQIEWNMDYLLALARGEGNPNPPLSIGPDI